jgi:hypothetical protein
VSQREDERHSFLIKISSLGFYASEDTVQLFRLNIKELFKGLYKLCECGQKDCLIPIINTRSKFIRFKKGHNSISNKGSNNSNWKGGRINNHGYWMIWKPGYFPSNNRGYVREHVYIYQESVKCCMLKWGAVHHIDFNRWNNIISNLQGMMQRDHTILHMKGNQYRLNIHMSTSDRRCHSCGSNKTYLRKPDGKNTKTPYLRWYHLKHDKINWYCSNCYQRLKKE